MMQKEVVTTEREQAHTALRQPGSILLISCYELGHQPLGIASPLAFLERAGYAPDGLDIAVERFDPERVARARFVGISVPMHTALRLGVRVAEQVRQINPTCHICLYGLYASLNADYLLHHVSDSVLGGEFETPLVALVQALEAGRQGRVEGVQERGRLGGPFLERLPFPPPSRRRLPNLEKYAHLERNGRRGVVGYVEASRGCLHMCLHCPIPPVYGGRFFVVPQEIVLEDIRGLVLSGATHITFGDPDFLNGPGHSLAIVRAMHQEFPNLTFDCTAKVEHILERRALIPELGGLGCVFMVSAFESLSDTVLANLEKGHTRADAFKALRIVRDAGFALRPSWVPFTPWTTLDDYLDILDFVETEDLVDQVDSVQFTIRLLVPPGSALLERAAIRQFLGQLNQASFMYPWTHRDPRMDELQKTVSGLVEQAVQAGEDPRVTFQRIRNLAYAAAGKQPAPAIWLPPMPARSRPPRLTESWFC
jgi:radical SAM superfamily enzyme YgiQ (UPF0313 family)